MPNTAIGSLFSAPTILIKGKYLYVVAPVIRTHHDVEKEIPNVHIELTNIPNSNRWNSPELSSVPKYFWWVATNSEPSVKIDRTKRIGIEIKSNQLLILL